jgi:condensin complex subunit 3
VELIADEILCFSSFCLQRMATNSFQLFLGQIQSAPGILKIRVLQIVFDILMVHEGEFLGKGSANVRNCALSLYRVHSLKCLWYQGERIIEFLLHVLDSDESEQVQALICMGLAKLMLAGMASEDRVSYQTAFIQTDAE